MQGERKGSCCLISSTLGFPGGPNGKESACDAGDRVRPLVWEDPRRWEWLPTAVFLPREFHGQRSLVNCSPWGCRVGHKWATNTHFFSQVALVVKNPPANAEIWVLGQEDPLKEGMATHSSILAWRIPRTKEPGGLQPMGSRWADTTKAT